MTETREDKIAKMLTKGFSAQSETRPKFTFQKGSGIADKVDPTAITQPVKITEEEKAKALLVAENVIKQRLNTFVRTDAWQVGRDQETREFAGKIVGNATQRFKLEKVAGSHEGEAISMDGGTNDRSGEGGAKAEPTPGGRVWASGIDVVGEPERNSPNRTFDISDSDQGTASGVIDTTAPKKPVNKPIGDSGEGDSKSEVHKADPSQFITVSDDESDADQSGSADENTDLSVAMEAMSDIFNDPLFLNLQRVWNSARPALRGKGIDTVPPVHEPPSLPSGQLLSGTRTPKKDETPTLVPPPAALRHPGKIALRTEEEPLSHDQLLSHKAKKESK